MALVWAREDARVSGVFYGMQQQIAAMIRTGGGSIVNTASVLYSGKGIRINAVGPGFIHTPMVGRLEADAARMAALVAAHPLVRLGRPEEVAELVAWLASD